MAEFRRPKIQIFYDMLEVIQKNGGESKPTHILYRANLSYKRFAKYLAVLKEKGFIEEEKKGTSTVYKITQKGVEFLREYSKVKQLSDAFGLPI